MLCNISQNAMRRGGTRSGTPLGGYPGQVPLPRGVPSQVPPQGGYLGQVPPGVPGSGTPGGYPVRYPPRGGTRVGQQKEYSLHGGRYASCVHAGGLSCFVCVIRAGSQRSRLKHVMSHIKGQKLKTLIKPGNVSQKTMD